MVYIGDHIPYLRVGDQKFAYDINIVACKYIVYFGEDPGYIFMDVDKAMRIIYPWRLQVGKITAGMCFALVHKSHYPPGYKIIIAGVVFWVVKNNDAVFASRFRQFSAIDLAENAYYF